MTDEFDNLLWAYRAVFTQTNAGGGSIRVNIIVNERMVLLFGQLGPDNYAADRVLKASVRDDIGGNSVAILVKGAQIDNETLVFPSSGEGAAVGPNVANEFDKRVVLGKGDVMQIEAASLIQNETFTIAIRALIRSWPPTITIAGSGGTVTTTTTYDKVI